MSKASFEEIYDVWAQAQGFLIDGRVCGDWSMPSPDELVWSDDEAEGESGLDEINQELAFYVHGDSGLYLEYFVNRKMIESGVLRGDAMTLKYSSDTCIEITPLFRRATAVDVNDELNKRAKAKYSTVKRWKMVCDECQSENVLIDAYAQWNVEAQEWEVANTFDKGAFCPDCDGDARVEEVEIVDTQNVVAAVA